MASPPSRPKRFVPVYFTSRNFSNLLRLDELRQNGALAFLGEGYFLVRAFNPLLQPALLGGIGDMHEFEADGAAIGSPQNLEHLGNGGILEPKHAIDEDLPCVVGFRD